LLVREHQFDNDKTPSTGKGVHWRVALMIAVARCGKEVKERWLIAPFGRMKRWTGGVCSFESINLTIRHQRLAGIVSGGSGWMGAHHSLQKEVVNNEKLRMTPNRYV
jgi:hypothetical protein